VHKCLLYDSLGFMTKERFEALHVPLVKLIEDSYENSERFSKRVEAYLKPAIVQLAVAVQGSTGSTVYQYKIPTIYTIYTVYIHTYICIYIIIHIYIYIYVHIL
jgi:hypothetical protein